MKFGHFPEIKPNEVLKTTEGRAEVLLAPGSFLRLAENTSIKMTSNRLSDTRFELLEGEILVESVDFTKDSAAAKVKGNQITVAFQDSNTTIDKPGLYQFNSAPARVRVYEGEALVKTESAQVTIKRGKETQLGGVLMAEKFDNKSGDELSRWSARRSGYLALANVSAAHSMYNDSNAWSSYSGGYMGGWAFNPMFGMYTFVPMGGIGFSPFGFGYYSPYTVGLYSPYYGYGYGGYGYGYYPGTGSTTGGGGGSTVSSTGARHSGTGNFGGNSPIRASASNHVGGAPGFSGGSSRGAGSSSSFSSYSAAQSNSSSISSGSSGGISSGGGMSSAGGGGARGGGGGSTGGGRGK
jgi:hypothetical protein